MYFLFYMHLYIQNAISGGGAGDNDSALLAENVFLHLIMKHCMSLYFDL